MTTRRRTMTMTPRTTMKITKKTIIKRRNTTMTSTTMTVWTEISTTYRYSHGRPKKSSSSFHLGTIRFISSMSCGRNTRGIRTTRWQETR